MVTGTVVSTECCVTWTVEKFTELGRGPYSSHLFRVPDYVGGQSKLWMWPSGDIHGLPGSDGHVSLEWRRLREGNIVTQCRVSLLKQGQLSHTQLTIVPTKKWTGRTQGCIGSILTARVKIIERSKLICESCLDNNRLIIHIKFLSQSAEPVCPHETQAIAYSRPADMSLHDSQFATNDLLSPAFKRWHQKSDFADMTVDVGNQHFKIHKFVFASRSQVFFRMFKQDMSESNTSCLQITDMTPEHFLHLVEYMYTGRVTNLEDHASYLLNAAEKYELNGLKAMCEEALISAISEDSALDVLALADLYRAQRLKMKALDYINQHALAVTNSEGWMTFMTQNTQLANDVVHHLLLNK